MCVCVYLINLLPKVTISRFGIMEDMNWKENTKEHQKNNNNYATTSILVVTVSDMKNTKHYRTSIILTMRTKRLLKILLLKSTYVDMNDSENKDIIIIMFANVLLRHAVARAYSLPSGIFHRCPCSSHQRSGRLGRRSTRLRCSHRSMHSTSHTQTLCMFLH